jgi:hypothetical protein
MERGGDGGGWRTYMLESNKEGVNRRPETMSTLHNDFPLLSAIVFSFGPRMVFLKYVFVGFVAIDEEELG